jgi:hypothetical protein
MAHSLTVYYRPDSYPDWVLWKEFPDRLSLIGRPQALGTGGVPTARAGFAPRLPLGKPSDACDPDSTNRKLRRGFSFQVRFTGTGHMTFERFRLHAQRLVEKSRSIETPRSTGTP